jgi:Holliday junction resolvasome RuvABC endonuclease subunit
MKVVGIDPGIVGGWAIVTTDGDLLAAGDLPVAGAGAQRMVSGPLLRDIVAEHQPSRAVVEQVSAMPKQGVSSSFKFGRAVGVAEGVMDGMGVSISWVTPGRWKKAMGLGADKEASRQKAIRRWPGMASLFARKKDHGRAEAALIALWSIEAGTA